MSVITYESRGQIAIITINRPEKKNSLTREMVGELNSAWIRFNDSDDRVAVLTGAGNDVFCAGADLDDIPHDLWRGIPGIGAAVEKPIIGAAAGWVVGGGLALLQYTDLLIAAENCKFVYPEAKVGFSGGLIASMCTRVPHKIAMELLLLGEPIGAQRAYEVGFVNKIVPVGQQLDTALEWAAKLAANAPLVLTLLKSFVEQTLPKGPSEAAGIAKRQVDEVTYSSDMDEGLAAFKAKRAADFQGV
jgi:enoyl-CoA hydratase/carnithine racemase